MARRRNKATERRDEAWQIRQQAGVKRVSESTKDHYARLVANVKKARPSARRDRVIATLRAKCRAILIELAKSPYKGAVERARLEADE